MTLGTILRLSYIKKIKNIEFQIDEILTPILYKDMAQIILFSSMYFVS